MKRFVTLLLLAGLLTTFASCGNEQNSNGAQSTTTVTTAGEGDSTPKYDDDDLMISEDFQFDLSQYATVPQLSDIKVSSKELNANWLSEEAAAKEYFAEYVNTEEGYAATDGDVVNIHYKGYSADASVEITEETIANMTNIAYDDEGNLEAGYDLTIGSGTFVGAYESETNPEKNNAGFEEQLIGMKAGETRTITVTFADDYLNSEELQGVVIKFDVTVNSIQNVVLPELTDEMVSEYTSEQFTDVASFKAYILRYYTAQMAYEAVSEGSTFSSYPEELLDQYISEYVYDYIDYIYGDEKLTDEETQTIFDEQYDDAKKNAESTIENRLVLETLFERLGITLTYAEYKEALTAEFETYYFYYYYYYGLSTEADVEDYFGMDELVLQFKYNKMLETLPDHVTVE
ncbi:MAG: FKBP-type peptidyl-prolyl cis-trans isomerase [Clostridia bacterium]|nr:FKBP-type peptidyl-prolyl cis-trans isomerase [Clostridia bacterium]